MSTRPILLASAALAAALAATPAAAADGAKEQARVSAVEELIVTAQRREENLQEVPVAVTALTGQALQAQQINSLIGLQRATPSLYIANFPGDNLTATITLRGLGISDNQPTLDPAVGLYLDGVYLARATGANLNMLDLERVEVLRGPQGTLFGRNTIGGAINIVTAKPTETLGGSVSGSYGNYDALRLQGVLNAPVTDDIAVRFAASHTSHSGFAHSSLTGAPLSEENTNYLRGQLRYDVTSRWQLLVSGDYTRAHTRGGQLVVARDLFGASAALISAASGGQDSAANYVTTGTPKSVPSQTDGYYNAKIWGGGATLTGDLGPATLKAILGYRYLNRIVSGNDLDGTPYVISEQNPLKDSERQGSIEAQLYGKALEGHLDWIVGAYYFRERGGSLAQSRALFPFNPLQTVIDAIARNDSASVFAQASYALTDQLRLTAGARYVYDGRELESHNRNLNAAGAFVSCGIAGAIPPSCEVFPSKATFSYEPFTVGLDYRPNSDLMLYAKFSRGFRAGGFNARGTTAGALVPFNPEHVNAVEGGVKSELLDHHLRLNAAAYTSQYENMQLSSFILSSNGGALATITNAGRVQIDGFEGEATAVLGGLMVSAATSYTDARFKALAPTVTTATLQSTFPYTPKWTADLSADYRQPARFGAVVAHLDYSWRDKVYFAAVPPAAPSNYQKAYGLVNASLAAEIGERTTLTAFVANLTNQAYDLRRFNLSVIGAVSGFPGDPRTYGVRIDHRF